MKPVTSSSRHASSSSAPTTTTTPAAAQTAFVELTDAQTGLGKRLKLPPAIRKRIHSETGPSLMKLKREAGWQAAETPAQKIKSKVLSTVNPGDAEPKRMARFVEHVINDMYTDIKRDRFDASYQTHSAKIHGVKVRLSVGKDANGDVHIHAFATAFKKNPALVQSCKELKDNGWTLRFGNTSSLNPAAKTVTVHPADPQTAVQSLWTHLQSVTFDDGTRPSAVTVERAASFLRNNDPTGSERYPRGMFRLLHNPLMQRYGKGDGVYNAVSRMLLDPAHTEAQFIPSEHPPQFALHDAVMILVFRQMYAPLNAALRNPNPATQVTELADRIDQSMAKLHSFKGEVVRQVGGPRSHRGPVTDAEIQFYERLANRSVKGKEGEGTRRAIIREPSFQCCSKLGPPLPAQFKGNVAFHIESVHGKQLHSLSEWDEVVLRKNTQLIVERVTRTPGSDQGPPGAAIKLRQIR